MRARKHFAEGKVDAVVDKLIILGDMVVTVWSEKFTPYSTGLETCGSSITIDRIKEGKFAETWYLGSDKPWIK